MTLHSTNTYFIKTDQTQYGPITFEMLKTIPLNRDTLVWKSDTDAWKKAEDIPELKNYFKNLPPQFDSEKTILPKHSQVRNKIFLYRLIKAAKPAFTISAIITIATIAFLWFKFQPNKFGKDEISKINEYLNQQKMELSLKQNKEIETPEERKKREELWRFFLKDAEDPFKNEGIVPAGSASSIPYEYVDGFWDYCSQSNGKVKLDILNPKASFESRKEYLTTRIIKIVSLVFLLSLFCLTALILNLDLVRNKK